MKFTLVFQNPQSYREWGCRCEFGPPKGQNRLRRCWFKWLQSHTDPQVRYDWKTRGFFISLEGAIHKITKPRGRFKEFFCLKTPIPGEYDPIWLGALAIWVIQPPTSEPCQETQGSVCMKNGCVIHWFSFFHLWPELILQKVEFTWPKVKGSMSTWS